MDKSCQSVTVWQTSVSLMVTHWQWKAEDSTVWGSEVVSNLRSARWQLWWMNNLIPNSNSNGVSGVDMTLSRWQQITTSIPSPTQSHEKELTCCYSGYMNVTRTANLSFLVSIGCKYCHHNAEKLTQHASNCNRKFMSAKCPDGPGRSARLLGRAAAYLYRAWQRPLHCSPPFILKHRHSYWVYVALIPVYLYI